MDALRGYVKLAGEIREILLNKIRFTGGGESWSFRYNRIKQQTVDWRGSDEELPVKVRNQK